MNETFVKHIEDTISSLQAESDRIKSIPAKKGFEVITDNVKRMYLYELDKVIGNNQMRLANAKKEDVISNVITDQIFNGGMQWFDNCRGYDTFIKLDTKMLMPFDKQLEIAIDITKTFNLEQCPTPVSNDKTKALENNLITGTCEVEFDLYDNYKIFKKRIKSFITNKNIKHIFNVEPYGDKTWDDKYILGFKINCA